MKTLRLLWLAILVAPSITLGTPQSTPDRVILSLTPTPDSAMAVNWRTAPEITASVGQLAVAEGGPDFVQKAQDISGVSLLHPSDDASARYHSVRFNHLMPETTYVYRVGDGTHWSEWNHFKTASTQPAPFSFIYYGDTQNDTLSMCARVMREAFAQCPAARFTLHAGDLVNRFNADDDWGEWFDAAGWLHRTVPVLAAIGNHEYSWPVTKKAPRTPTSHWSAVFELPRNGPTGMEEQVYYVDYQGARIVVLNSNEHHAEQAAWLESVLENNPCRWTIVSMHHPVYSSFPKRNNTEVRNHWQPLFDQYQVDLVLQGHDHTYQRSGPMQHNHKLKNGADATQSDSGTVYVVSVAGPKQYTVEPQSFMRQTASRKQLFQVITIDGDTLRFAAYSATAECVDAFSIVKEADQPNQLIEADDHPCASD